MEDSFDLIGKWVLIQTVIDPDPMECQIIDVLEEGDHIFYHVMLEDDHHGLVNIDTIAYLFLKKEQPVKTEPVQNKDNVLRLPGAL